MQIKAIHRFLFVFLLFLILSYFLKILIANRFERFTDYNIKILPHPQELSFKGDSLDFVCNANTVIIVKDTSTTEDKVAHEILNKALESKNILPLTVISAHKFSGSENAIVLGENNNGYGLLDSLVAGRNILCTPPYLRSEEYRLDVDPQFIVILGKEKAATFYGVQTLIQLLKKDSNTNECKVAAVRITDFPDMPIRCIYYGFHLKDLDDESLILRGYDDILKFAKYKFNMIGLDNHHYGHLEMEVPDRSGKQYWERFSEIFAYIRKYHLQPRIGGWARWFDIKSPWSADLTTIEGIRTTQTITMKGTKEYPFKISSGHIAHKVIHDFKTDKSWSEEPILVTDEIGQKVYKEDVDYIITFAKIESPFYDKVIYGEGEPAGYPLRRGESYDPPTTIRRTLNSKIENGQTVKVTFSYIGPDPWSVYKARYCRSDPRLHTDGPNNYIWRWCVQPITYLDADVFNLEMDEIRVFAWDKRCLNSGKSRSQIFADDIKYYYETIKKNQPNAQIMMWSDMLDPYHNARLYRTEKASDILSGYGMSDIIMVPWNYRFANESIDFFNSKGFSIIASSQQKINKLSVSPIWAKYLRDRFENSGKLFGLMHAPWDYDYDSIDGRQRLETTADYAWSVAPYIIHTPIKNVKKGNTVNIKVKVFGDRFVFDGKNIKKGHLPITSANLYYRSIGSKKFLQMNMNKHAGKYRVTIPGEFTKLLGIEYYIEISDKNNTSLSPKSAPAFPYQIKVHEN